MWIPQDPRLEPLRKVPLAGNLDEGQAIIREFVAQSPDDPYLCLWWAYGSLLVSMFEEAMELSERAAAIFRRRLIGRKRLPVWATRRAIEIERGRYESLTLQMKRGEPMTFRRVGMWERMNNAYYIPHDMRHSLRLVQVDAEGIRLARWPMGRVHRITWSNVEPSRLDLQEDSFEKRKRRTRFLRRTVALRAENRCWEIDTTWIGPEFRHPQLLEAALGIHAGVSQSVASVSSSP